MSDFEFFVPEEYRSEKAIKVAIALLEFYLSGVNDGIITYGDLSKRTGGDMHPHFIEKYLGEVSYACKENGLPLLSALVISKDNNMCGDGFFTNYFPEVKRDKWMDIWSEEYKKIKAFKEWDKVLEKYKKLG